MERILIQLITAFTSSLGFAYIFNVKGKRIFYDGIGGFLAWGVQLLAAAFLTNEALCYLLGSAALTAYAEGMARWQKCPTTLFIVAGSIPLIPGGALYRTMSYGISRDWQAFFNQGLETLLLAVAISAGILIVMVLDQIWHNARALSRKRKAQA